MTIHVVCSTEDMNLIYCICDSAETALELQKLYQFPTRVQERLVWTREHLKYGQSSA